MKQVLAVRVGAKKAVGHIVSKKWWPTVPSRWKQRKGHAKDSPNSAPIKPLVLLVDWNFDYYHVTRPKSSSSSVNPPIVLFNLLSERKKEKR